MSDLWTEEAEVAAQCGEAFAEWTFDITRHGPAPQFDERGHLILATKPDPTRGTALAAFMDCLLEGRPYCSTKRPPPAKTAHTPIPWPEVEHERAA